MSEFLKIITKPFSFHQYFLLIPLNDISRGLKEEIIGKKQNRPLEVFC